MVHHVLWLCRGALGQVGGGGRAVDEGGRDPVRGYLKVVLVEGVRRGGGEPGVGWLLLKWGGVVGSLLLLLLFL